MAVPVADLTVLQQSARLGGTVHTYPWQWQGQTLDVVYETVGAGPTVLLLPAFSTVSTRAELAALAQGLVAQFRVVALDWPGFGDSQRPRLEYGPALYEQFLQDFVAAQFSEPVAVVAAGHAAGYATKLAARGCWSRLVLVAPTWRGPLAVMGAPAGVRKGVRGLVRSHLLGPILYGLNTRPAFLKWMYRRHVFTDEAKLTPEYIEQRYQTTQQNGARYAPGAFVTGGLDPVETRDQFLALLQAAAVPVQVIVAEQAPPYSKAEMEIMVTLPQVQEIRLPGTLGMAEEYGSEVAAATLPFLTTAA